MPSQASLTSPPQVRGQEAQARILQAALRIFGRDGFALATTRRIAEAAGVSLPAIKYYFENKEGLYMACAHEIVARYEEGLGNYIDEVAAALEGGLSPAQARSYLKEVMRRVSAISNDDADADLRTGFVLREMTEQGPAFEVLYKDLWQPGVEITAQLIACIEGKASPDEAAHLEALMLHASLSAFSSTRPVSLRYLRDGGCKASPREGGLTSALTVIEAQIDRMGPA
ncbi:DUF1956 domain-containing protein [Parahaliea maris]|uniref:DUF1956 domain-containing protein n=1 Tax=Parahaliea maris TaxID=2716870 RepID=A0A5C8ZS98_9GAMM|nr:TetR/AcrR family transcriptional regulator [Parahaliea maris]TXS90231.1 DUF1956 domain-containing protein [Parahaliea maris]